MTGQLSKRSATKLIEIESISVLFLRLWEAGATTDGREVVNRCQPIAFAPAQTIVWAGRRFKAGRRSWTDSRSARIVSSMTELWSCGVGSGVRFRYTSRKRTALLCTLALTVYEFDMTLRAQYMSW